MHAECVSKMSMGEKMLWAAIVARRLCEGYSELDAARSAGDAVWKMRMAHEAIDCVHGRSHIGKFYDEIVFD